MFKGRQLEGLFIILSLLNTLQPEHSIKTRLNFTQRDSLVVRCRYSFFAHHYILEVNSNPSPIKVVYVIKKYVWFETSWSNKSM